MRLRPCYDLKTVFVLPDLDLGERIYSKLLKNWLLMR
jgi:hypothetical protein